MLFRSNDTATTEIYTQQDTLSLHDALPIFRGRRSRIAMHEGELEGPGNASVPRRGSARMRAFTPDSLHATRRTPASARRGLALFKPHRSWARDGDAHAWSTWHGLNHQR